MPDPKPGQIWERKHRFSVEQRLIVRVHAEGPWYVFYSRPLDYRSPTAVHGSDRAAWDLWAEKAEVVDDGPCFYGDDLYMSADELVEHLEDNEEEVPEFAFAAMYQPVSLDVDDIIANLADNHHEDCDFDGQGSLAVAIDEFNKANEGNGTYWEDRKHKVRLREAKKDA